VSGKSDIVLRLAAAAQNESEKLLTAESAERRRRERREKTFPGFLRVLCGISQRSLRSKAVRHLGCRLVSGRFHREEVLREAPRVVIQQLRNEGSLCSFADVRTVSGKSDIDAETCRGGTERRIESETLLTAERRRRERREKTFPGFLRVLCGISQRSLRSKAGSAARLSVCLAAVPLPESLPRSDVRNHRATLECAADQPIAAPTQHDDAA